ncbi:antitoxin Xre/MbcA/ParS toxin-binding domain-containing protein [Pseudobacteriovorax antillogorgiicola]|uniref:Antitoxin Xre/MbcA/ParS-like toxin-binding domain-containing protein n=1 Tax=Pseudobacteriovorax antillogorgiicola TaxID=1513793 RepID=A0A1Y6CKF1_9BACT|nr:antitoxin Xre/MbcA/ParS toxin-binding domain-containing protein [Pseudobacteriovorax antillogorgiicola]TCS47561.1 uncharacterized protein DUF2384 [Pseudobacteriovorax antillogorgiicola]SMF60538.1 Protein of unknown function [Pseudobacteriovorax antillogorgiicola]
MSAAKDILQDRFGLWADTAMRKANGEKLRQIAKAAGKNIKSFSKEAGLNRTIIYQEVVPVPEDLRERLIVLTRIIDNAVDLFDGDMEAAERWLYTPNRRFMNFSPFSMALAGKGETVCEHQEYVLKED